MKKIILTLPMMPVDGENYGKFVTPIICEALRNILNGKYYHCVNLLDSFNDRSQMLDGYIKSLNSNGIKYDALWYDNQNKDILINNIEKLVQLGYISEMVSSVYKCDCGVVEIEESKIATCNPNNLKFTYKDGEMYCKTCGSKCQKYSEKILVFTPNGIKREAIAFLPDYLNRDIKTYEQTVLNSYLTISRDRNTGVQFDFNGRCYNIDIDFLWATYLANFPNTEKVVVSGNKMVYQLFLVGVLEKCLQNDSKTVLLGTPYIDNLKQISDNPNFLENNTFRKLAILFSMKWKNKNIKIDDTILKYLKKLTNADLELLYSIICNGNGINTNLVEGVDYIIKNQFNMQNSVKVLKRERR